MAITGLRLVEAVRSYNLIIQLSKNNRLSSYNEEKEALEHFRYEELFLRKGKRMGLKQRFSDLRELHGSILTRYLSESGINFLHGRIGASVYAELL